MRRIGGGHLMEKDGIEDAEQRGVDADPESERQDCDSYQSWAGAQCSGGVSQILKHVRTLLQLGDRRHLTHLLRPWGGRVSGIGIDPSDFIAAAANSWNSGSA